MNYEIFVLDKIWMKHQQGSEKRRSILPAESYEMTNTNVV